jgi:hypothetical protein
MAETTTSASGAQAAPGSQPQVGASQAQAADAQSSQADGADNASGTEDVAALRRELEEARRLAARYRTERRKLESEIKATEDAKLPEQERLQRRLADLERQASSHEQERRDWQVREAVTRSAEQARLCRSGRRVRPPRPFGPGVRGRRDAQEHRSPARRSAASQALPRRRDAPDGFVRRWRAGPARQGPGHERRTSSRRRPLNAPAPLSGRCE